MILSDLPLEIFRSIIECAVLEGQHYDSMKRMLVWDNPDIAGLSRVNSVFEREVFGILAKERFLTGGRHFPSKQTLSAPFVSEFLTRYIEAKHYKEPVAWSDHFSAFVNEVVDQIIQREQPSRTGDARQLRTRYLYTLCSSASLDMLCEKRSFPVSRFPLRDHVFSAATHMKKRFVLDQLLEEDPEISAVLSDFWQHPLSVAVSANDAGLVQKFVHHGARWEQTPRSAMGWACIEDAVRASNAVPILSALLEEKDTQRFTTIYNFGTAINIAIDLDKEEVAFMLLDWHRNPFGVRFFGERGERALTKACKKGMKALAIRLFIVSGWNILTESSVEDLDDFMFGMYSQGNTSELGVMMEIIETHGVDHFARISRMLES